MKVVQTLPPTSQLGFGKYFTPWMVSATYRDDRWLPWEIVSTESFRIDPGAKVLHYAQEIFEGLKIFRRQDGSHALFRPYENIRRMEKSAEILAMPPYPEAEFMAAMKALAERCRDLIPSDPGALYLRPTMIATTSALGVSAAKDYVFFILASPVGGYFGDVKSDVPANIAVWVTEDYVRAFPGGLGAAKTGANYAASLRAVDESKKLGYANVMFLDGLKRQNLEELSGMNVFVVDKGVLKTPRLGDTILNGVTRATLLQLAKLEKIPTEECDISIERVIAGLRNREVSEIFACGTGASVSAITELGWRREKIPVGSKNAGEISTCLYRQLLDIQTGRKEAPAPDWIVKV